ncbi:unnamed protein product [Cylindrotheca closterium]|uniref:Uncharacterized protein n=1 Tax=Cylindrotheca closterium TaxID=2856 RepID=A0AAD2FZH4_9STRA|nr:unnamed protein product [Cylindrotheca closterium]
MAIYHTEVSPVLLNQCEASNPKEVALIGYYIAPLHIEWRASQWHSVQESDEVIVVSVQKNPSKAPESLDEDEDNDADDTEDRENTVDDAMEEDDDDERVNSDGANTHDEAMDDNTPPLTSHNPTATQDSAGTGILMEPSETTPPCVQRPPTLAERFSNLIQVNIAGVPGKCHIFETTFSVDYQGSDSGTVADALLSTVLNSMDEAINNSPHELKLLPHCFTWRIHAKRVDRTLRSILHPATAKSDFPFAAPATYISDWKLAQQGLLSVKAYGPVKDAILTLISQLRDYYILTEVLYPGIDFTGMFKFATTRLYGSCTLFKLLLSIKATLAQADQASTAAKDKPSPATANNDSSEEEDDETQERPGSLSGAFTKVTKKKVKKKKKLPLSNNLENHFLKDLSPAQRKLAEATDRKLQNNIDRHKAGPLFLMILPVEMEGSYIFVCCKKYEIQSTRRKFLVWCTNTLRAIEASDQSTKVEEALEFLDDVIEDTTDVYQGQLLIDMDMANAKDIDDGQTVTGMLDEMQEREQQVEDAFVDI